MNKILIASQNPHKQKKLYEIFEGIFSIIETPETLGLFLDIEENESTFLKNAELKARTYSYQYDDFVVATDAGLSIPSLGDKWNGLRTKRFAGEYVSDFERMDKLLGLLDEKKGEEREMIWNEAIAVAYRGEIIFSFQVDGVKGLAQRDYDEQKYKPGIWVCSIWYFPQWDKNFFDLNDDETAQVEISWNQLGEAVQTFFNNYNKFDS